MILHRGCCLEVMGLIPDKSIDLILADLPYGQTKNSWDSVIDLGLLWRQYERILKPSGVIVLNGQGKFTAKLVLSNESMHRYNLVWEKTTPTGHLNAKIMPLRSHEDIIVFYRGKTTYNPQKTQGHKRKVSTSHHKRKSKRTTNYNSHKLTGYDSTERYPKSILKFPTDKQKSALHPTQKPVALVEYLIKTFSNEGDTVMDNVMGSGTTGIACINTNRNFIGIEKDEDIFQIASTRIQEHERKN